MLAFILRTVLSLITVIFLTTTAFAEMPVTVEFFMSSTCPHCHKAERFFDELQSTHPWLSIKKYVINVDKAALTLYAKRLQEHDSPDFQVPSMFFCGSRWTGFDTPEKTGKRLLEALEFCHTHTNNQGVLSPSDARMIKQWSKANMLEGRTESASNPLIHNIILLSLVDAFSICAWFVLAAFLAFVGRAANTRERIKIGLACIAGIFCMHFFQQYYAAHYFQMLYAALLPGMFLALFVLYQCWRQPGKSNGLHLILTAIFTMLIFAWQQSCPESWSEANAAWLANQNAGLAYDILYQILYILPLLLILGIFEYITRTAFYIRNTAKFFDGFTFVLMVIALFLLVYPSGLANNIFSWVIPGMFVAGLMIGRLWRRDRKDGHKS